MASQSYHNPIRSTKASRRYRQIQEQSSSKRNFIIDPCSITAAVYVWPLPHRTTVCPLTTRASTDRRDGVCNLDQLAIQKAVDESSDISLDFQGISEDDDCCKSKLGHVMISCDDTTKDICLRIATYLKVRSPSGLFAIANCFARVATMTFGSIDNTFPAMSSDPWPPPSKTPS